MNAPSGPMKPTHYLILLLLTEEPTYGVALMERLEARSHGKVRLNAGSLYRTLATLVDEGWVEPRHVEAPSEGVGAPRKIYGVTARGRACLAEEAHRQADLLDAVRALDLLGETR